MTKFDKAKQILLAGFCINLCMGILYAWSVFKQALVLDMAGLMQMLLCHTQLL